MAEIFHASRIWVVSCYWGNGHTFFEHGDPRKPSITWHRGGSDMSTWSGYREGRAVRERELFETSFDLLSLSAQSGVRFRLS
jgi:hypothetical protein